ncbi:adenylosuccinate synthase [Methylobacterium sp. A52T]
MAFKPRSAAETKARDLGLALARLAEDTGTPAHIGVDRLRRASPRLTPLAVGQMVRRERDTVEATLAERGLALVDYSDQGPGRGMEFVIDAAA